MAKLKNIRGFKKGMGSVDILNAIRTDASALYQERIPEATDSNLREIHDGILENSGLANEFIHVLMNRIGLVLIKTMMFTNPLQSLKKGKLEMGMVVENVFVEIAKAKQYVMKPDVGNEADVFEITLPDVKSEFYEVNREDIYPVTIYNTELSKAFLSYDELDSFIARIIESLYTGNEVDEFLITKGLLFEAIKTNKFYDINVDDVTDEASAKKLATQIRVFANRLKNPRREYNHKGVLTTTPKDKMVLLISDVADAHLDVEVLAYAFNMNKADVEDVLKKKIVLDNFGGDDTDKTIAMLVDEDFINIWDRLIKMTEQYNAKHDYWNYFLHVKQIYATCGFANAIRFTSETVTPSVVSVSLTSPVESIEKSTSIQLTTDVVVTDGASRDVTYAITDKPTGVSITTKGKLTVTADATVTQVVITATSKADSTKVATLTLPVTELVINE